jgi:hypothetical protein
VFFFLELKMNDRELLELAAKAAGIKLGGETDSGFAIEIESKPYVATWNPLTDDGDALRLAVRLGMNLSTNLHHRFVTVNDEQEFYDEAKFGGVCDPDGVMRRTIVRVAAEIGRQMQKGGAA